MPRPSLIVVTGPPGAGKTTLAHPLARAVRCPAVCRDEIKEGLVNAAGEESEALVAKAYDTFFDALGLLLGRGVTALAEAAFQHAKWAPRLEPLTQVADLRIVVCAVDPETARERRAERDRRDPGRARFHPDRAPSVSVPYDPPRLDVPTLTVRTSEGYDPSFEAIVAFARIGRR